MMKERNITTINLRNCEYKDWIDLLKGIGIVFVIIGHTNPFFGYIIYGFHMPLFFMVSGYLHNPIKWDEIGFKKYIQVRFNSYIRPYIFLCLINLLVCITQNAFSYGLSIKLLNAIKIWAIGILFSLAETKWMPNCTPLWFLVAIFISSIMFFWIIKLKQKQQILCCFFILLTDLVLLSLEIYLPWNINSALLGCVFMCFGYLEKKNNLLSLSIVHRMILSLIGILIMLLNTELKGMASNSLGNPMLFFCGAIIFVTALMSWAQNCDYKNQYFIWLGKNTIFIIGFNYFFNNIIRAVWSHLPFVKMQQFNWCINSILVMVSISFAIYLWKILKTKFLFLDKMGF